ncbi:MAG: hypothetical protein IT385_12170 [Deltaproteobacteria bacterium]|nr:hypothetical protein [Deltaproteobacteria bacterium]
MMRLCGFCLEEPGPCAHPECPFGAERVIGVEAQAPPRPATRPSIVGGPAAEVVPTTVSGANARAPHIATAPSVHDPASSDARRSS